MKNLLRAIWKRERHPEPSREYDPAAEAIRDILGDQASATFQDRRDAQRYRFIRDHLVELVLPNRFEWELREPIPGRTFEEAVDAAMNAAIAKEHE